MTAGDGERDVPGPDGAAAGEREHSPEVEHRADAAHTLDGAGLPDSGRADTGTRDVPHGGPLDFDDEFARIVAAWGTDPVPGVGPWPAVEDLEPGDGGQARGDARPDRRDGRRREDGEAPAQAPRIVRDPQHPPAAPEVWRGGGQSVFPLDGVVGQGRPSGEDDGEGYVPPEPPPIGTGDLFSRIAWAAVLGGPLFLVVAVLFWEGLPQLMLLTALAAFVGGFVALVARMPRHRDEDDDDGAVV